MARSGSNADGHVPPSVVDLGSRVNRYVGLVVACLVSWWIPYALLLRFIGAPVLLAHSLAAFTLIFGTSLAGASFLAAIFAAPRITVGAEGLGIRVSIWRYFVPYRRLANVRFANERLVLEYVDGRTVSLYAAAPKARCEALLSLVDEARRAHARRDPAPDLSALDRTGRSLSTWREALASLLEGARAYRDEPIDQRTLVRVLADVDVPAERRIAAAIALASQGGQTTERIRAAACASASEPLRIALERAADGTIDEEAVDRAVTHERTARRL